MPSAWRRRSSLGLNGPYQTCAAAPLTLASWYSPPPTRPPPDVTALAHESIGTDATSARTREDFVVLVRELFRRGLYHNTLETT